MRKAPIIIIIALIAHCVTAGAQEDAKNLLSNPGFEQATDGKLQGWRQSNLKTEAKASIDTTTAHSGKQSARIDGAAKARGATSISLRGEAAEVGSTYKFTAWVKVDGTSNNSLATCARITFAKGRDAVGKSLFMKCGKGPFDWKPFEITFTVPEGAEYYNLVLFHHGEGTAWWDDVSLVKVK